MTYVVKTVLLQHRRQIILLDDPDAARIKTLYYVRHESGLVAANAALTGAELAVDEALDEVENLSRARAEDVLAGRRVPWRFNVALGDPATELIAAARHEKASAIVVGGRTHGLLGGFVVGSVAQKLVRHSPVSVLVVRDGRAHQLATPRS